MYKAFFKCSFIYLLLYIDSFKMVGSKLDNKFILHEIFLSYLEIEDMCGWIK